MVGSRQLDEQAIVANVREAFPEVQGIYLFGSYADGTQRPGSDVDLALLFLPPDHMTSRNLAMHPLQQRLHGLAGCDFDLVDLRRASTVLQKEVVMLGRRIYCANETAADEFDVGVMSRYQKLNEERAGILEQFGRRVGPTTYERHCHQQDSKHAAVRFACAGGVRVRGRRPLIQHHASRRRSTQHHPCVRVGD